MSARNVPGDLRAQLFGAAEFLFLAQALPESHFDAFRSRLQLQVEHVGFNAERRTVERRAHTDVRDRAVAARLAFDARPGDVNAAGWQELLFGCEIQRWERKAAAGTGAANNLARECERPPQKPPSMGHVALRHFTADDGARNHFAPVNNRGEDYDLESVLGTKLRQQLYVACLLMPEAKIFANQNGLYVQIANKNLFGKFLGRAPRQFERERQDHGGFKAERVEPLQALGVRGKARRRGLRAENLPRRRVKRESRGDRMDLPGTLDGRAKNGLMTKVDAIEVADGQQTAVAIVSVAARPGLRGREHCQSGRPQASRKCPRQFWIPFLGGNFIARVDLYFEVKPIVGQLHLREAPLAQTLIGFSVWEVVRDVGEPRAAGLELLDESESLFNRLVHRMGNVTQRIEHQFVESLE